MSDAEKAALNAEFGRGYIPPPEVFPDHARIIVADLEGLLFSDVYVVWFAKTLQNWKALVSTDVLSGVYWEITHNGDKAETYVDRYQKASNRVVPD